MDRQPNSSTSPLKLWISTTPPFSGHGSLVYDTSFTVSRSVFAVSVGTSSVNRQPNSLASRFELGSSATPPFSGHSSSVFGTPSALVTKAPTFVTTVKASSVAGHMDNSVSKEPKLFLLYVTLGPLLGFMFVLCLCGSYLLYKRWLARRRNRRVAMQHPSEIELIGLGRLEQGSGSTEVSLDTAL